MLRVKSINEDGTFICEWADGGTGGVTDVQIDKSSVVYNGIFSFDGASMEWAYSADPSARRVRPKTATAKYLRGNTNEQRAVVNGQNFDTAVRLAMCDGRGDAWTADEQQAAQERLGILSFEGVTY